MKTKDEILDNLPHFIGTSGWYKLPHFPYYTYTDGIRYLAQAAEAYWLLEYIFSNQSNNKVKNERFQVWKLSVEDGKGSMILEDGNYNVIKKFEPIEYTDFPLDGISLWFIDGTLLLPSEY